MLAGVIYVDIRGRKESRYVDFKEIKVWDYIFFMHD